jgi:hypothetical protein
MGLFSENFMSSEEEKVHAQASSGRRAFFPALE